MKLAKAHPIARLIFEANRAILRTSADALRRPFQNELTVEPVEFGRRPYFLATCNITLLSERQDMRWRCLQEASEQVDERTKLWDGSGF